MGESPFWNQGDYCLRTSLYIAGKLLQDKTTRIDRLYWKLMLSECRLGTWFGHRKSIDYTWEKDVHGGKPSLRCRAWMVINWIALKLKFTNSKLTFYCGLNLDQYRGLFIALYLTRTTETSKKIARRIFWGYICRLGMSPSFTEWAVIKPQSFILLFRMLWYAWPLYPLSWAAWRFSKYRNLLQPIRNGTTNKISLLPTMYVLGHEMPTDEYISGVYRRYFNPKSDEKQPGGKMIRESLIGGISGGAKKRHSA